jgi:hypothetical protein
MERQVSLPDTPVHQKRTQEFYSTNSLTTITRLPAIQRAWQTNVTFICQGAGGSVFLQFKMAMVSICVVQIARELIE